MLLFRAFSALLLFCLVLPRQSVAQNAIFLSEGKIEFEKKVNLYAQMDEMSDGDNAWVDLQKKTMPQFKTTYFDLVFTRGKSLYKPGRDNSDNNRMWEQPAEDNVIYSDLEGEKGVSQKRVFEQVFLIQDSLRQIKWKITEETRVIAGFNCRRANAIIMDSIYVVAFYTDEILPPGGPESFTGLPGMILGISLPHVHMTWFATKVQAVKVAETEIIVPQKGKKITNTALKSKLKEILEQYGKFGRMYTQTMML